jgi:hypothetical protein
VIALKVRVYFCREPDAVAGKIGLQALDTIYDLVWESELKNVITIGRLWLRFKNDARPFGHVLKQKRPHDKISAGDIIQAGREYFMVGQVGVKRVELERG